MVYSDKEPKRIVIAGMGFAGLNAARGLCDAGLNVTVIDRNNYHLFQPLLYQVATAGLEQESIAYPLRALVRGWGAINFRIAEVTGLDIEKRRLVTDRGDIEYDYLIMSGGSVVNYFGNEAIESHAFELKSLSDAEQLRNSILSAFEQASQEPDEEKRRELLSFVVVGGGPTGVEFAGALSELVRFVFIKDYPDLDLDEVRIVLLEASDGILAGLPPHLGEYAAEKLRRMGVELRCNSPVADATGDAVLLGNGERIPTRTLLWSAGVKAAEMAEFVAIGKGPGGRIPVTEHLTLPGHDDLLVAGDMAFFLQDGRPLPMMAPVAIQQGRYLARYIIDRESGRTTEPFRYVDKGSMATIGRNSAVASAFGISFSGFLAWLIWLFLHLYYLIGFRNRIVVLLNWAWYYWFHERQVRLITSVQQFSDRRRG